MQQGQLSQQMLRKPNLHRITSYNGLVSVSWELGLKHVAATCVNQHVRWWRISIQQ